MSEIRKRNDQPCFSQFFSSLSKCSEHSSLDDMVGISEDDKVKYLALNHITSDPIPPRRQRMRRDVTVQWQNPTWVKQVVIEKVLTLISTKVIPHFSEVVINRGQ